MTLMDDLRAGAASLDETAAAAEKWFEAKGRPEPERLPVGQVRFDAGAAKVSLVVAEQTGEVLSAEDVQRVKERAAYWRAYWKKRGALGSDWWVWALVAGAAAFVLWNPRR